MDTMVTITITESDARRLHLISHDQYALRHIAKAVEAALGKPTPKCPHTKSRTTCGSFATERDLTKHLVKVHHYADDEYGEDTAQTNAWTAFHSPTF